MDTSDLTLNGGETASEECDVECAGTTTGEICGGSQRMSVYSIDCFGDFEVDAPYMAEGCYVDSPSSRVLGDGETADPMSTVVRASNL